jgi:hypothetical protein
MRVAVVILNWNGRKFLERFLPTVVEHSKNATIYVVDNASSDGSELFITSKFPSVKTIQNGANIGFAGGYNEGLKHLTEDVFVLLNSDVKVSANWLDPVMHLFKMDSNVGAVQPKILQFDDKTRFEYAGGSGGFIDKYGFPFCRGRMFDTVEVDHGQFDDASEVFWATGACMFVRSSVYKQLGGLDADFFAHMEEIDLCWRMKRAGFKVMVQPASVVYHVGGGTLSRSNPWKTFLNFRNGLELLTKNLPKSRLWSTLFIRMCFDGVAAIKFLAAGQPKDFLAVFRAHMAFYGRFRSTLAKRNGNYGQLSGVYQKSIVWDYFIAKKQTFAELKKDAFS